MEPIVPTDEEIMAIRRADWSSQEHWDAMGEKYHEHMTTLLRENFASPGYQAFLLGKMADAFDAGMDAIVDSRLTDGRIIVNPYREQK